MLPKLSTLSKSKIYQQIDSVPEIQGTVNFKGVDITVAELKENLKTLIPHVFRFKKILDEGFGGAVNTKKIFKAIAGSSVEGSSQKYQEALEKLESLTESFGGLPVQHGQREAFIRAGTKYAQSLAMDSFFMDLAEKLDFAIARVIDAKKALLEDLVSLDGPVAEELSLVKVSLESPDNDLADIRQAMRDWCELQALLNGLFTR